MSEKTAEKKRSKYEQLGDPFPPEGITWKAGATTKAKDKCLAMAYADLRAYQYRLDEVLGPSNWEVEYQTWGDSRIIAYVTVYPEGRTGPGVRKGSTGETDNQSEKSEIGGTVAEAQAFKRACAAHGLGRYLYEFPQKWVPYENNRITDSAKKDLQKMVQTHYDTIMNKREFGDLKSDTVRFIKHIRNFALENSKEAEPQQHGLLIGRLETIVPKAEDINKVLGMLTDTKFTKESRASELVATKLIEYLDPDNKTYDVAKKAIQEIAA